MLISSKSTFIPDYIRTLERSIFAAAFILEEPSSDESMFILPNSLKVSICANSIIHRLPGCYLLLMTFAVCPQNALGDIACARPRVFCESDLPYIDFISKYSGYLLCNIVYVTPSLSQAEQKRETIAVFTKPFRKTRLLSNLSETGVCAFVCNIKYYTIYLTLTRRSEDLYSYSITN